MSQNVLSTAEICKALRKRTHCIRSYAYLRHKQPWRCCKVLLP